LRFFFLYFVLNPKYGEPFFKKKSPFLIIFISLIFFLIKSNLKQTTDLWQCEVSDQIKNKRTDQMFKNEFKNDPTVKKKIKSEQITKKIYSFILLN
jgi:hypothetical protein